MALRLIIRTDDANMAAHVGGDVLVQYRTFDVILPEVEEFLCAVSRSGDHKFSHRQVVGVEVVQSSLPDMGV